MQAKVVFLFRSYRRDVAIQLFHASKDFIKAQKRGLVWTLLEAVAESIINKRAAAFQLFLCSLGHFADNGLFHPFPPLVYGKGQHGRCRYREQVIGEIEGKAIILLGGVKDHFTRQHTASTIKAFKAELF